MINTLYQLVAPKVIIPKKAELSLDGIIIRPTHLSICHADQRYYRGLRSNKAMREKLPMALIHEASGVVVKDDSGSFARGSRVIMIPNIPPLNGSAAAENYQVGAHFMSSGIDGFMQEYVKMPADRLIPADGIPETLSAMAEFVSVACHSVSRLIKKSVTPLSRIGIWGDGNLGFVIANVVKSLIPDADLVVIGQNPTKLNMFSFAAETYLDTEVPDGMRIDHAFECTGGQGCEPAIDSIISHINPEGCIMLMGVSEASVPIYTRNVLEKGLTMVGSSRSGRTDFEQAAGIMRNVDFQDRLSLLISDIVKVSKTEDINKAFEVDINNLFRTIILWNM